MPREPNTYTYEFIAIVSGTRVTETPRLEEAVYYQLERAPRGTTKDRALIVHGACGWKLGGREEVSWLRGTDRYAHLYARLRGIGVRTFPADWDHNGLKAGPVRSFRMIDWAIANSAQCCLYAFPIPGGSGTRRAIAYAEIKGVEVRRWFE